MEMGEGKDSGLAPPVGGPLKSDRWVTGAFLLFLASVGGAATYVMFRDGKGWVLLMALAAGVLLWGLEGLETRYAPRGRRIWHASEGYLLPVVIISLAIFVGCLPTLNIYFIDDDFAYLHNFHTVSLAQFLRLFHTDMAQILWGEPLQELRPFYGLYYMVSYQLWGLNPMGYHLSSVFLHVINALLVFLIVKSVAPGESWRAGLAGLLFAVLPLHSDIFCWATGAPAELLPVFFYLAGFLCFMRFRATGLARYLVIAVSAFAGCLSSKETAVTLPALLVSYDLFRKVEGENGVPAGVRPARKKQCRWLILSYLPFAVLLLAYLAFRRIAFGHFLRENAWVGHLSEGVSDSAGFLHNLAVLGRYFESLQAFYLRHLLLPFPAPVLGLVLGLYLVWVLSVLRRRSECHRSIAVILYFGLVWYLISNLPLLIVVPRVWHLYLPAIGPCVATSFLAFPAGHEPRKGPGYLRLLGFVFLVFLSASQLWKENTHGARRGEMSAKMTAQLRAALEDVPKESLVVIWPGESFSALGDALPYSVQAPFTSTDLCARVHIVPGGYLYGRAPERWEKIRLALSVKLAGPPDEQLEIHLLTWDELSSSLQRRKRVLSRSLLQASVTKSLGGPVEAVGSVPYPQPDNLVKALAGLVAEGG
jgi:hypothetical protein